MLELTLNSVRTDVLNKTLIGGEITIGRALRRERDQTTRYMVEVYYPHFVLAVDGAGLRECFAYIDVWKSINKGYESEVEE